MASVNAIADENMPKPTSSTVPALSPSDFSDVGNRLSTTPAMIQPNPSLKR
jgi:hypothetical protein